MDVENTAGLVLKSNRQEAGEIHDEDNDDNADHLGVAEDEAGCVCFGGRSAHFIFSTMTLHRKYSGCP